MADALSQLRRCIIESKSISYDPATSEITLDVEKFPSSLPTRFRNRKNEPYTLGALYFFHQQIVVQKLPHHQYINLCAKDNFPQVSLVDKNIVSDYLTGAKDEEKITQIAKLEVTAAAPASAESAAGALGDAKGLSQIMSSDKLAELKAKRLKAKGDTDALVAASAAVYKPEATIKDIMARERPFLDRRTVLQAPKKNFSKILERLQQMKDAAAAAKKEAAQKAQAARPSASASSSARPAKSGYDRFNVSEDRVWKTSGIDLAMDIDTRGTFDRMSDPSDLASLGSLTSKKRSYDQMANGGAEDMDIDDDYKPSLPVAPAPQPVKPASAPARAAEPAKKKRKYADASLDPIVVVPSSSDAKALLHMANCEAFLKEGKYVDERGARIRSITIEKPRADGSTGKVTFTFTDGSRLNEKDWDRVVCVVVNGTDWQFKAFPLEMQTPANLFTRVKGFYLRFEDEPAPPTVRGWNVAQLTISKARRHLDETSSTRFWNELTQFIRTQRPEIRF